MSVKVQRDQTFPILMFDMSNHWSSWPVSAWFYALWCCHLIASICKKKKKNHINKIWPKVRTPIYSTQWHSTSLGKGQEAREAWGGTVVDDHDLFLSGNLKFCRCAKPTCAPLWLRTCWWCHMPTHGQRHTLMFSWVRTLVPIPCSKAHQNYPSIILWTLSTMIPFFHKNIQSTKAYKLYSF